MLHERVAQSPVTTAAEADLRESARLEALGRYDILDTPREASFDRIARLVRDIFGVRIALVSVIDGHRQWHKACEGLGATQADRRDTICQYTIASPAPLIVPDLRSDERFADNPFVAGEPHLRFYAGVPLRTPDGHNIGTLCAIDHAPRAFSERETSILADLAAMTMDELELRQLVAVDALTGVLSRRAFRDEAARAMSQARRGPRPLGMVAIDIDHFKSVNDTYGHAAGDTVLAGVAAACRDNLRAGDAVGRLGGEEFAALLPGAGRTEALDVAEKLRAAVEKLRFGLGGKPVGVTASFGVAALDQATSDVDALMANADAALYEAKGSGRNRCVGWRSAGGALSPRRRVLKAGSVVFNKRASTIDCTVRTLAEDGAGLDVSTTVGVPDAFVLLIRADGIEERCRVTARTDRHLEVEFDR